MPNSAENFRDEFDEIVGVDSQDAVFILAVLPLPKMTEAERASMMMQQIEIEQEYGKDDPANAAAYRHFTERSWREYGHTREYVQELRSKVTKMMGLDQAGDSNAE